MKLIIIGLGNFGSSLAQKLTEEGNEVIGIDNNMTKVEGLKSRISHTICMDSTDQFTMAGLPFDDTDIVIVAIGEDQGANIMTTALLKKLNVKRLVSRAINPLHETVLQAMGVDEIVHPEEETAERWSKKLHFDGVLNSFDLNNEFSIIEVNVYEEFIGKTLNELQFRQKYNLLVLTIIKMKEKNNMIGKKVNFREVQGIASPSTVLQSGDILVMFGKNDDIEKFLK